MVEPRVYATPDQFWAYVGEEPDSDDQVRVQALLVRASALVDSLLLTALYDVDRVTLMPTDPRVAFVLQQATCAQAQWFEETGDVSGAGSQYQSGSAGPFSFTRGYGAGGGATGQGARIAPEAVQLLVGAGLINAGVYYQ
jgi:hypothetical protein